MSQPLTARRLGVDAFAQPGSDASTPLKVLLLPPHRWDDDAHVEADGRPAFESFFSHMRAFGVDMWLANPLGRPFNPFASRHGLYQGIDIVRTGYVALCSRSFDAVFTVTESPALLPLMLRRIGLFRLPIIADDIGLIPGWSARDAILRQVVPKLDGLLVVATHHIDVLSERFNKRDGVKFVPVHVDTDFFTPSQFDPSGPVLTIGDDGGRDYQTLHQALDGLDVRIIAKTRNYPVVSADRPHVEIIPHRLSYMELRNLYARARFVVIALRPSVNASGVSSLTEAMAAGKAVIISDSPGIRDYVKDNHNALVVPCNDPTALRAAVERLGADAALCQRLGAAAREFVVANCSYPRTAARTAEYIRSVVEQARSKRIARSSSYNPARDLRRAEGD
jgi:glycosyltransferase involved in cell wall biosynthesis